jgi:hypothetical protein
MGEKIATVEASEVGDDGRLRVTVAFGKRTSQELNGKNQDAFHRLLTKAARQAVQGERESLQRIVAHVPVELSDRFDELCKALGGINRSRTLLGRVARYVRDDGELIKTVYNNKAPLPSGTKRKNKRIVQIFAPKEQVEGFDRFCRTSGIKKDVFVMREMSFLLQKHSPSANRSPSDPLDPML